MVDTVARTPLPQLRLPRATGSALNGQVWNHTASMIERADIANAKLGMENRFPAIVLTDANGVGWRVTVTTSGILQVTQAPRS